MKRRLPTSDFRPRGGFTLIELLVVIGILLIVVTMTIAAVNFTMDAERIRSGARQMQSYLAGARDRAIYAREPRGVRFIPDENIPGTVSSMVYVGQSDPIQGVLRQVQQVPDFDGDGAADFVAIQRAGRGAIPWSGLLADGLLVANSRIRIPDNADGRWYNLKFPAGGNWNNWPSQYRLTQNNVLVLATPYDVRGGTSNSNIFARGKPYKLELAPAPLEGEDPVLLPQGIVVDLNRSQLPNWTSANRMDIMFSPRGTVTGPAAAQGLLHFYLSEGAVAEELATAGIPGIPGETAAGSANLLGLSEPTRGALEDRIIATLFTRTGNVSTHPVNPTDQLNNQNGNQNPDGLADDPFLYAETGEVAGQ